MDLFIGCLLLVLFVWFVVASAIGEQPDGWFWEEWESVVERERERERDNRREREDQMIEDLLLSSADNGVKGEPKCS